MGKRKGTLAQQPGSNSLVLDPLQPRIVTVPAMWAESCDRDVRGGALDTDYASGQALF